MNGRAHISGVLLLDKPAGWTSTKALGRAKHLLQASKAGHTGTLDPFATGLLPLCFGEATKFSADLLDADKTYLATARLGVRTTTGDIEGEAMAAPKNGVRENAFEPTVNGPASDAFESTSGHPASVVAFESAIGHSTGTALDPTVDVGARTRSTRAQVEQALARFRGPIDQIPPMHSALKREGRPLYELARRGIEVERAARRVVIHALDIVALDGDVLTFRTTCSKGTYVRVLAQDIGDALGRGAHLTALRRERAGPLDLGRAIALDALEAMPLDQRRALLQPLDALLGSVPRVDLDEDYAARFEQGQRLNIGTGAAASSRAGSSLNLGAREEAQSRNEQGERRVRVYAGPRLLGTAWLDANGRLQPQRLIAKDLS